MIRRKASNVSDREKHQKPKRASSFGTFDRFRHQPHSIKPEETVESSASEAEHGAELSGELNLAKSGHNGSGLGKTMRAISKTMKKKMARKYIKALSEEMYEGTEGEHSGQALGEHEPVEGAHGEGMCLTSCESVESLYSLNSGQSSSSGITSGSDAASNRDSIRLEEEPPLYAGPFCGRAKVHTDFTPSPYDTDSFKLKKGDVIEIISKPTMGTWTGMLNNKVGNFKFIYVDILPDEVTAPKKIRARRKSKRVKPTTLQELLERIHLQDLHSTLLLNGYQTLDDFKDLKESHLIELNITDPDHRARLLIAADLLSECDAEDGEEEKSHETSESQPSDLKLDQPHLTECPRDSGCYITSENSDNGKDDMDSEHLPEMVESLSLSGLSGAEGLESS
eukprot:gi/632975264/ref/XP_007904135.1/ PREDICTED: SAM domain-containing protein SAMSN-1 [Callorhinchus milii]